MALRDWPRFVSEARRFRFVTPEKPSRVTRVGIAP